MVKKTASMRLLCLALFLVLSVSAFAQDSISVQATPLHRFITQNATLGHFLTSNFSEGSCCPFNYAFQPFPAQADIVPVVPGYAPRPDQGLFPVHAWQVDERPRIYYYYNIYFGSHGSNYRYLGIIGYALAKFDPRGTPFHYWYSQSYGYYYTLTGEFPPCCTFTYHDTSWRLPVGGTFIFDRIPDPPDPCPGMDFERQQCAINGGNWDDSTLQLPVRLLPVLRTILNGASTQSGSAARLVRIDEAPCQPREHRPPPAPPRD